MKKKYIFIILFLVYSSTFNLFLFSENEPLNSMRFEKITQRDGLSQGSVFCVLQDSKGFIWFGTQSGLNRYDGYKFEVFLNNADDSNSISSNRITSLFEDSKGMLWVGTDNGLNKYNDNQKKFIKFFSDIDNNSISNDFITSICEDKNGNLWIGTNNGLNKYNSTNNSFIIYKKTKDGSINHNRVSTLYKDRSEKLWIGTIGGGLNRYIPETDSFKNYYSDSNNAINFITTIYEDTGGEFWIGTNFGGLARFNRENGKTTIYSNNQNVPDSLSNNQINFIIEDKNKVLWIGTQDGLNRFNKIKGKFFVYKNDISNPHSLNFNILSSVLEDNSGALWIGTMGKGINKYTGRDDFFKKYIPERQNPNSLNNNFIFPIIEDRNKNLWLGTQGGGINKINRKENKYSFYKYNSEDKKSISSDYIYGLYEDKDGIIWIGTSGRGLNKYIIKENSFKRYEPGIDIPTGTLRYFLESDVSPGIIWMASSHAGLVKYIKKNDSFELFFRPTSSLLLATKSEEHKELNSNKLFFIYEAPSKQGYIWLASDRGLNRFDIKKEKFIKFGKENDIINNIVLQSMVEHSKYPGILWIGTMSRGLIKFNMNSGIIESIYTINNGLPDNVIYGIIEDNNGFLWLSTNKGLAKFDIEKNKFFNYDVEDGLQGMEFNGNSFYKSSSGEMFFGGTNGFNSFFPDKIIENKKIPSIYITGFKVFNESIRIGKNSILKKNISETKKITLPYYKNTFSFEFVALDFTAPRKNKYAYKLINFDDSWHQVGYKERVARYMNLNPGTYVFKVKGSNNDGIWNEKGVEITIIITPPFWNTFSFKFSLILLLLLLFLILYKNKMKNVSSRLRLETELKAAHKAQMSIMPQNDPDISGFDISGLCMPASEVGGDFYDYLWLDTKKDIFGIAIGDVSGKAMKAAMTAIMTNGILFSQAAESDSIKEIMTKINRPIYLKTEKQVFTALCLISININSKIMSYTNAGLNEPILKSGNSIRLIKQNGIKFPLGVKEDSEYIENDVQLKSGDTLILYTDGVSEAVNTNNEFYGIDRFLKLLKNIDAKTNSAKEIIDLIMNDIDTFSNGRSQNDDITIVIVKLN